MNERTLLFSALGATALAAIYGVVKVHGQQARVETPTITPVSMLDPTHSVSAAEVPIRLTSSDGTGLKLVALRADAAVEDPLALTELYLTFENPEDRVLEGTFRMTLPQGASLSRFSMKVNEVWQEGEVVEKQAARRAYEDFLHRKQDPALMEQGAGNEFTARVFPIPARSRKEIKIAYSEVLEAGAPYVLPLRGLPQLGSLDVNVAARGARDADGKRDASFGLHQTKFTPGQDFVVAAKQLPRSAGLRSGELAIARVVPFTSSRPEPVGSAVIMFDTSASRGLGIADQVKLLEGVLAKLPGGTHVTIGCFDQDVVQTFEGKANAFDDGAKKAILDRDALGASDVESALAWAAAKAKATKAKRVILIGDGVATAGETDAQALKVKVEDLRAAGVERMDAVAVGGIRDDGFLRTVVRGVLDKDGVVLDAKLGSEAIARRLSEATTSGLPVAVEGASWSWPEKLDGLQAGDEVMVFAQVDPSKPVKVKVGTQEISPDLRTAERPLVERAWAQAKISSLLEAPKEGAAATKAEIIRLSTRHRVVSPHTAMLVLETDADYTRFSIDRTAKLDILTVKDGRVTVTQSPRDWREKLEASRREEAETRARATKDEKPKEAQRNKGWFGGRDDKAAESAAATATAAAPPPPPAAMASGAPSPDRLRESSADEEAPTGNLQEAPVPADGDGLARNAAGEGGGGRGQGIGLGAIGGSGAAAPNAERRAARAEPSPDPSDLDAPAHAGPGGAAHAAPRQPAPVTAPPMEAPRPSRPRPAPTQGHVAQDPYSSSQPQTLAAAATGQVNAGTVTVDAHLSQGDAQRGLRAAIPALRACYATGLTSDRALHGRLEVRLTVEPLGSVSSVTVAQSPSRSLDACFSAALKSLRFPAPADGTAHVTGTFDLVPLGGTESEPVAGGRRPSNAPRALPYEGRFKTVMEHLANGAKDAAIGEAKDWHRNAPGDVMALVALGEAFEANGDVATAARAYGSILELFSFRADSRRFAGERLERLSDARALTLAIDTYKKAVEQRPDHPASHRLYAFALLKKGDHEKAFEAMKKGASRMYPAGRFAGVDRILKEDLGLVAAAWSAAQPARAAEISQKLRDAGGTAENGPSLRFVLNWETDANDVDFHIYDGKGGHAYYGQRTLGSGGELYADVTTGYGPECFTIRSPKAARSEPYTLQAHYYSRGPMGYGMGKLQVIDHDGKGHLTFEERPFVVMVDRGFVDLGTVASGKGQPITLARANGK